MATRSNHTTAPMWMATGVLVLAGLVLLQTGCGCDPEMTSDPCFLNSPPNADAGANRQVQVGDTVTLNAGASTDADGDALSYAWELTSGPQTIELDAPTSATPSFVAPVSGTFVFQLTVTDACERTDTAVVNVAVGTGECDAVPVAMPVADRATVCEGLTVTLDGSGSTNDCATTLTYAWTQTDGPDVTLVDADTAEASFEAPAVDEDTDVTIRLVVDNGVHSNDATVIVTVLDCDEQVQPPVADAGEDQLVDEGQPVTLDGTGSYDPADLALTYAWTQTGGPDVVLTDADTATATFTAPAADEDVTLTFELTVSNGTETATASTAVTVRDVTEDVDEDGVADAEDNCPDAANEDQADADGDGAGDVCDACPQDDQKTEEGVCGCDEVDADDDQDTVIDCVDNCPGTANTDQADADGDGVGDACDDDPVNTAPTADDQSLTTEADTNLDITLTGNDADGDTLTYTIVAEPGHGTLTGDAPSLVYDPDDDFAGEDSFTFTVNDGTEDSAVATVTITVNEPVVGNPIRSGETVIGTLSSGAEVDTYTFSGTAGDTVILRLTRSDGDFTAALALYPPSGGAAEMADFDPATVDFDGHRLGETGTYNVTVRDHVGAGTGDYFLSFIRLGSTLTSTEDADGGAIPTDGEVQSASIDPGGDLDAFSFTGQAGQTIVLRMLRTGDAMSPEVRLYDPSGGAPVATNASASLAELDGEELEETGTYTIVTCGNTGAFASTYQISLTVLP